MSWERVPFESLYAIPSKNGLTRPARVRGSGYKMINMGELFAHDRIGAIDMELVPMNEKELETMLVDEGDLMFARQSLVLSGAGKCSIVKTVSEETTFESHIIRVRLKKDIAYPNFFFYYFKSPQCGIKSIVTQGVQAGIRGNDLKTLPVALPPMDEQIKIADILMQYDDLIENNDRRIQLLEESARLLYQEWFVHLRFPGHEQVEITDGVPEGWEIKPISSFGRVITGKTPSTKNDAYYGDDVPFIKTPDMHGNVFVVSTSQCLSESGSKSQQSTLLPSGCIMVSCIGTVGVVSINPVEAHTNQQINSVIPGNKHFLEFLFCGLKKIKPTLEAIGASSTMNNVNKSKFSSIEILVPSERLITEFHFAVVSSFELILSLQKQNLALAKARDLLLPKLMSGELTV